MALGLGVSTVVVASMTIPVEQQLLMGQSLPHRAPSACRLVILARCLCLFIRPARVFRSAIVHRRRS